MSDHPPERFLRLPEVCERVGLRQSAICAVMALGTFPRPRVAERRAVLWLQSELEAWMHSLPVAEYRAPEKLKK